MATRLYAWGPGQTTVQEGVGGACSSQMINLTVDLDSTLITEGGSTRVIKEEEVLKFLEEVKEHILRGIWPPA